MKFFSNKMESIIQCKIECQKLDALSYAYGRGDSESLCQCICYSKSSKQCKFNLQNNPGFDYYLLEQNKTKQVEKTQDISIAKVNLTYEIVSIDNLGIMEVEFSHEMFTNFTSWFENNHTR